MAIEEADALKREMHALREEVIRLSETWDRSIRITWALLAANFLSFAVVVAIGFGWL